MNKFKRPKTSEIIEEIAKGKGERAEQAREIIRLNKEADRNKKTDEIIDEMTEKEKREDKLQEMIDRDKI